MEIIIEIENNYCNIEIETDFNKFDIPIIQSESNREYNYFFENILSKNIPCIIKNISSDWESVKRWTHKEEINIQYLREHYGDLLAPVADCEKTNYNAHCKNNMKVSEYLDYFMKRDNKILYLKDWHLRRLEPDDLFYDVPHIFASDWLNEYAIDNRDDDFMFVYIGPENSWTPLHSDVYNSYSWSVNVIGSKKWILFPPGEEEKLKDALGNLPLLFDSAQQDHIKHYEIIQEKNDAMFIPSGWHHQVMNLKDTVSINHNWINGCNISLVWEAMQKSLLSVENEINEFKDSPDFTAQCQLILKSLFGMNYDSFINFVVYIAKKRINQQCGTKSITFGKFILGEKHVLFDLYTLLSLLKNIDKTLSKNPHYQDYAKSVQHRLTEIKNKISNVILNK